MAADRAARRRQQPVTSGVRPEQCRRQKKKLRNMPCKAKGVVVYNHSLIVQAYKEQENCATLTVNNERTSRWGVDIVRVGRRSTR
jgi:hypothetical protein